RQPVIRSRAGGPSLTAKHEREKRCSWTYLPPVPGNGFRICVASRRPFQLDPRPSELLLFPLTLSHSAPLSRNRHPRQTISQLSISAWMRSGPAFRWARTFTTSPLHPDGSASVATVAVAAQGGPGRRRHGDSRVQTR